MHRCLQSAFILFVSAASAQSAHVRSSGVHKVIEVHEGTDMAAAVSPDHRTILIDLQGMIYSLPFSGGRAKRITGPVVEASHPVYSPKGDSVAIQSYQGGTFHIWTMHPDGTSLKQMTFGHGDDREPTFSPDGRTIAFASDRAFEGSYDIWTVDVASGSLKRITSAPDDEYEPSFAPDGKSIAYVDGAFVQGAPGIGGVQGRIVASVDLASGATKVLVGDAKVAMKYEAPSFSSDGKLAVVSFEGAGMFSRSATMMVVGKRLADRYSDTFPFPASWISPAELVYTANGRIVHADLSRQVVSEIPFSADIEAWRPAYAPKRFDFDEEKTHEAKGIFGPALSPDGRSIAFVALNQMWLLTLGHSVPKALTHDMFYKQGTMWSPDGKQLAYVSDKDGVENIYIMDVATREDRPLAASKSSAQIFPAWSPDAKSIAWQDQTGATWMTEVASGKSTELAPASFFPGRPSFSPDGRTVLIATVRPYTRRFREGTSSILAVDVASRKTSWFAPAPFESVSTRTEDGPIYSPARSEVAFVMDDLLYTMPVDGEGHPTGTAVQLNNEITDAPTWSADGQTILYASLGKLHLIDRASKRVTNVPLDLTWKQDKPTGSVLIHAARVWTGEGAAILRDQDVFVSANRIVWIAPHGSRAAPGARYIEAPESTLMPGLWENHAHPNSDNSIYYGDRLGRLWMLYGITTLRDMADQAYRALEQKESFLSGAATGPRLFATGEAIDGERTYYPMMIPTTSEDQLHREFTRLKALDFDFMKLYVRLPYAWVIEGAQYAHSEMGVQTAGHYLLPAVTLGNDGMSHVSATARTGYAYSRSLTGSSYEDVRDLMAQSGMWTTSTLLNQGVISEMPSIADDPRYNVAPPWEKDRLMKMREAASIAPQDANMERAMREEATVKAVIDKTGIVIGGTDSPLDLPSTSLHLNLISQVKYGLQPWQALETVTSTAARAASLNRDLGTISPGKLADMILVKGNPLEDIKDITRVQCVMKNGRMMSVAQIARPFEHLTTGEDICPAK